MLNKFRHKNAPILTRHYLAGSMTQRETVRLISEMTPDEREDYNLCVRLNTCNPENGEKTFNTKPRIVKHPTKRVTIKEKQLQRINKNVERIIARN